MSAPLPQQRVVAAGFVYRAGRVLLAQRALTKRIAPGAFHLPGGHVEFGEDPAAALQRELEEEFHIRVAVGDPFATFTYRNGADHTIGIAFLVDGGVLAAELSFDPHDTAQLVWAAPEELETYLSPHDHNLALARKAFATLALVRHGAR